jgi:hypothetical protein
MRSSAFIIGILSAMVFSQSPIPRDIHIYNKSGVIDTIDGSQMDSVGFRSGNTMVVYLKNGKTDSLCAARVDSVKFPYIGGPAIILRTPVDGAHYRLGDTLILSWTINPICIGDRVTIEFNMHDGGGTYSDWHEICIPDWQSAGACQPRKTDQSIYTGNMATMKIPLTDPMTGGFDTYSPVSDSCRIRLSQYESGGYVPDLRAISGRFSIRP